MRRAVVTGVTSGIGQALVERLLRADFEVVGVGRDEEKLASARERLGSRFSPVVADLASHEAREEALRRIGEARVDVLVNNAAECVYESPLQYPVESFRRLLEVNAIAALHFAQALAPRMRDGGHLVDVSSVTTRFLPNARFAPYALTKVAVERLTEALRLELDPLGVKTTLIVPGLVDTAIYDKVQGFDKARAKLSEQVPTWLSADDVADAIVWAIERPPHVVVAEIVLLPRGQAR